MSTARGLSHAKQVALQRLLHGRAAALEPDAIRPRAADAVVPISAEQEHVWLHAAMAPDEPLYNEAITIHRRGACNPALLAASLNEVIRRTEIWCTDFQMRDGSVVQRVHDRLLLDLPLTDLTDLPPPEREAAALRLASDDARVPFDLSRAPLLRGRIVKLDEDEHRLYLTLHHIIFDGVSIYRVLLPTLASVYADLAAGFAAASEPAPAALQYGDYALWRAGQVGGRAVARQLEYWTETLAGETPVLRLPADRPPPRQRSHRGGMETFALAADLSERIKRAARGIGVTRYVLLLTAFQALLFRYTGQTDLVVGGVVDMRRRRALEPLMGYFLNTLPLRTRPAPSLSLRDYARQTSLAVLGMLDNCDVPFSHLVRRLQPRRDVSHPLFQVLFSIEPPAAPFAEGWDLTQMDVAVGAAKFDLYLELDERPEGLIGRFLYSADLFDPETIRRMIGHWCTLVEAAVDDPDCPLERLALLTRAEVAELDGWNATTRAAPQATLHALVAAQARATPEAVAVAAPERSCTYAALDRQADAIAGWLCAEGVGPGVLVAVCLERTADIVAALLGILKAGAAYMPLDPSQPPARLAQCLGEAAATVLLTRSLLRAAFPQAVARVLLLEEATEAGAAPPLVALDPDSLAYVLCTSGSTGKPKVVEVTHRAVVNLLAAMQDTPGFAAGDALLAVTTLSFDIAALELFLPLMSGGRVILASREVAADPFSLAELIDRTRPAVMQATPSTWRALVDAGWPGLPGLRLLVGGEALSRELADALLCRADSVWNLYGPTETTIWSTLQRVQPGEGAIPIGRPVANTTVFVLDPHGNRCPVGVPGELHIGGYGVARGYRNQPALTRQHFIALPATAGQRVYATSDIARLRADGTLDWLGRTDDQVKIRGHRIGLGEIEAVLETHPAIAAAMVQPHTEAGGTLGLTAWLVAGADKLPDAGALRRFLGQMLPDAMLPGRYLQVPALPLMSNGKRDRAALPAPSLLPTAGPAWPCTAQESRLAALYAELLGCAKVGGEDSFFDLGGHSLLAARLIGRIEQVFGRRLPLAAVFASPTVAELARCIDEAAPPAMKNDADRKLMLLFESLGDDCEFGLVQRRYGAEPLSLLRFTGIAPEDLLDALVHRFAGIAEPAFLSVTVSGAYVVHNARYRSAYQIFAEPGTQADQVRDREAVKLRALWPMLIRTLERGSHICVVRSRAAMRPEQAARIAAALRRYGPSTLLWIRLADATHPPGMVAWVDDHLMAGWIDRFAPVDDPAASSDVWLTLCREACRLWQATR